MEPYSYEELQDYLLRTFKLIPNDIDNLDEIDRQQSMYNAYQKASDLYICGINTPSKINYYRNYEPLIPIMQYAKEISEKITYMTPQSYIPIMFRFEDRYFTQKGETKKPIDACLLFLEMLISILDNKLTVYHKYSYEKIMNQLIDAKYQLQKEPTLRRRMLLFKTFYNISNR